MVAAAGSERLPQAVPLVCGPATWPSPTARRCTARSPTPALTRVSRSTSASTAARSVLGVPSGGVHDAVAVYDEQRIHERSKAIMYGIDARAQRFPDEERVRLPAVRRAGGPLPLDAADEPTLKDYNLLDLAI